MPYDRPWSTGGWDFRGKGEEDEGGLEGQG